MARFDAVVVGAGPAGEHALGRLLDAGMRTALVERELIGGECSYWACVPTKTLLRAPDVVAEGRHGFGVRDTAVEWDALRDYRDYMTRHLDDSAQVRDYEERGVTVLRGAGRLDGPGRVRVGDQVLETDRVLLAARSDPAIPPIEGLAEAGYWTNREATQMREVPASAVIVGGGPVGVELAQLLARLGSAVTVVQRPERVLDREEAPVGERLAAALRADGVELALGVRAERVRRDGGLRRVTLSDGREIAGEVLIVASGRRPRAAGLGLETVGLAPGPRGQVVVDDRCRAGDGVWAIGDCTGVALFTHVGKYQGRVAAADMQGKPARADYRAVPRVVFSDPEVAVVGLGEQAARDQGIDVVSATLELPEALARPYTYERDPRGTLGVVADRSRGVLVGAWAVAPLASEWIHYAVLAVKAEIPVETLLDTVAQFPTYAEGYLGAVAALDL